MEKIISFAKIKDNNSIYELFSQTAKDNTENLNNKISALIEFLNENITSCKFKTYIIEKGIFSGEDIIKRELMFTFNIKDVIYRCNICDIIQDKENRENLGIYSIAIYPEELYFEYSMLGYDKPGIFQKKLTIKPNNEHLYSGGIVTLNTSLEATVTCDKSYIKLTQEDSDVKGPPVSGLLRFNLDRGKLSNEDVMITNITRKTVGSTADLTEYISTKEGYSFTGWYVDKELTEHITEIVMEKESIVYAGWEKIK